MLIRHTDLPRLPQLTDSAQGRLHAPDGHRLVTFLGPDGVQNGPGRFPVPQYQVIGELGHCRGHGVGSPGLRQSLLTRSGIAEHAPTFRQDSSHRCKRDRARRSRKKASSPSINKGRYSPGIPRASRGVASQVTYPPRGAAPPCHQAAIEVIKMGVDVVAAIGLSRFSERRQPITEVLIDRLGHGGHRLCPQALDNFTRLPSHSGIEIDGMAGCAIGGILAPGHGAGLTRLPARLIEGGNCPPPP